MRTFFKLMIVLMILLIAGFIAKKLIETKPTAKRKPISIGTPLVEVIRAEPSQEQVKINAMGTVVPAKEVNIQPQVSGHIIETSSSLIPGGYFNTNETLLRIDDRDYKIAVDQKRAEVAKAMVELKTEKGRQAIARKEWELLSPEISTTKEGQELALRKPHIEEAEASLESARSALEKAKLDVERTIISAPFNAFVKEKFVEVGQHVTPGTKLLTLVGTDEFWVRISVPVSRLPWILIPGMNGNKGSPATVIQENSDTSTRITRQGRVIRLLGDLDPVGRMARILIAVQDPFGMRRQESEARSQEPEFKRQNSEFRIQNSEPNSQQLTANSHRKHKFPLLLGAYVNVEIQGPVLNDIFTVPRQAFREGDLVWTVNQNKKLAIKKVEVIWRKKDDLLVRGLSSGDMIITSRISAPVDGMDLRVSGDFNPTGNLQDKLSD